MMKSQFQRFQQQQQQQRQRMAQGAAWMEQQKIEQQKKAGKPPAAVQRKIDKRFAKVEQEAAKLRKKYAAGKLSEESLIKKLSEMMVQDANGYWWIVGVESGDWYYHDGSNWVPGNPPVKSGAGFSPAGGVSAGQARKGSKLRAFFTLLVGVPLSAFMFYMFASGSYFILQDMDEVYADDLSVLIGVIVGLICLILFWREARKTARGI